MWKKRERTKDRPDRMVTDYPGVTYRMKGKYRMYYIWMLRCQW